MLAAEGRSGRWRDHADALLRNAELLRELAANAEGALRPCPHRQPLALQLGERGARLEWHVRDVGSRVGRVEPDVGLAECVVDVSHILG